MTSDGDAGFAARAVDAAIKIGLVALLAAWCLEIVRPFMLPLIWGPSSRSRATQGSCASSEVWAATAGWRQFSGRSWA